ncbi:serine hydrolase [Bradyrhizobium sp. sBnM-33]|uniref:serine hydrolase domain-containing protein n=1 Tax=Bradyrhizobium sp. sBnM-33 TaxID=2831780 RepID=UPI001BCE5FF4|nr:serine hydrolase [Bradyrhizobium sp. sBnM-33]WOH50000.1 serine hydrolase [Bradyrhizobium sp. sBnM-33]
MTEASKKLRRLGLAAVFVLAASGAAAQLQEFSTGQRNLACGSPAATGDGWPIATPESVGLDGPRLCGIAVRLVATNANVHAVVIVRHGKLVFEQYFPGYDEPWGLGGGQHDFDSATKHDMRSVSKSVISLLVGIAIDRELIKSVDEPVVKFFPDYSAVKSPGWDKITLRHLLTMSSGIKWDENRAWKDPENDEPHLGSEADPYRYVLSKPIAAPPDTVWTYNGGGTDLLGNIIERVTGQSLEAFAREALFAPLGISDWEWMKYRNEHVASAVGLRLRPRDAAKIGQLVLNKGEWAGRRIVSSKWIEQSVTPRFQAVGYFGGLFYYGQHWWMGRTLSGENDVKWIAAMGLGGQRLFIVPELDLVVMTTSGLYGSGRQGHAALDILANFIIPHVRDRNEAR